MKHTEQTYNKHKQVYKQRYKQIYKCPIMKRKEADYERQHYYDKISGTWK